MWCLLLLALILVYGLKNNVNVVLAAACPHIGVWFTEYIEVVLADA